VKTLTTRAIPQRFNDEVAPQRGAIANVNYISLSFLVKQFVSFDTLQKKIIVIYYFPFGLRICDYLPSQRAKASFVFPRLKEY